MMKPAMVLVLTLTVGSALAQTTEPQFEVASLKLATPESLHFTGLRMQIAHGTLNTHALPLRECIQWAWQIQDSQISGPDWLGNIRLDITAKAAGPIADQQLYPMLRKLLADRLGIRIHMERKEMSVYVLSLGKGGPKFTESTGDGPAVAGVQGAIQTLDRITMYELVAQVANSTGRPVVDETGLFGHYDIRLDMGKMVVNPAEPVDKGAALLVALQQQLGLKVETRKQPIDVLVIDHAEKTPTEN